MDLTFETISTPPCALLTKYANRLRMFRKRRRVSELEAYTRQLREYLDKFREERDVLARRLDIIEWRLRALIKVHFPSRYKDGLSAEDCITILSEELNNIAETISRIKYTCIEGSRQDTKAEEQRTIIYAKLERLDEEHKGIFKQVLLGYCTVNSLAKVLNIKSYKIKSILSELVDKGWLDVLKVRPLRHSEVFDVYFPSPYGLIACEKLLNASWTFAQAQHLKELKQYISDEDLIDMAKERLRHAHKHILSIKDDPAQCLIRYSEGSHKADLLVDGRYVECESLSNDLEQTTRMCKALHEAQDEIIIIVPSLHAIRMMLQRVCLASWRFGYSLRLRIAHINELSRLEAMRRFMILRPPKPR